MSTPSTDQAASTQTPTAADGLETASREELTVQVELLRERNRQLREEYLRSQQQRYRRSAIALVVVGVVSIAAGAVLAESQTILFALGGTGIFGGILTYALTPERFIAASVSGSVFDALAADRDAMLDELGLAGTPVYVPADSPQLYVPAADPSDLGDQSLPAADELTHFFVTDADDEPGVALTPTGKPLLDEFKRSLTTPFATTPASVVDQLTEGLVENFELADGVETSVDAAGGRVTIEFDGLAYGRVDRIDHPVCSLIATGLAVGLNTPVRATVDETSPALVTFRWDPSAVATQPTESASDVTPAGES